VVAVENIEDAERVLRIEFTTRTFVTALCFIIAALGSTVTGF
jgi:hypothetical protein